MKVLLLKRGIFMEYIVYITDECKKEARMHNYSDALDKLALDVEQKQDISRFQKFPPPFLVKKQFGDKQGRLIAAQENVNINGNDYAVIKFLAVLIKANKEYDDFQDSTSNSNNRDKFLKRVDPNELRKFVDEKITKEPPPKKQDLTEYEQSYIYGPNATNNANVIYNFENESLIYESDEWIKAINNKPYINYIVPIYNVVCKLAGKSNTGKYCVEIENMKDKIILSYLDYENKYLFLIGLYNKSEDVNYIFQQWEKRKSSLEPSKLARRAYPQYLLGGETDLWIDLEKDSQSNFALSGEEINILKSITNQNSFPLFINGRAGSGKSTILQFLFAEYFFRYLTYQDTVLPPVYFTYNLELLKKAKKFVNGLLKTNSKFTEDIKNIINDEDLNNKLNMSFNELRKYLLSIADDNIFFQDKYVSYSVFSKLWYERFKADRTAQKEYPADICWHVIRTYIEGISPDDYLEPEEYVGLEKDQKTVSPDLYKKIFKTVWEWYKEKKDDDELWDDQDLVRYIIENDLATPRFSGIFCDESQDFTRIEMEVIYRLSIFSQKSIPLQYISRIPFVFVGDELQTINPTGFRWDAITALITEKFILSVYPDKSKIPAKPNFKELMNNYRSTQNIVNFCNSLQLFRANRFEINNLMPQESWEDSSGPEVARFDPKDAIFWQGIKEKPDSVVFIIPCNEGDEINWIKNDPELIGNISIQNDTPNIIVLSANSAKGLEFEQVVVWKFGSQNGLDKLIFKPENEDDVGLLPLKYHINKTYVAISRAKNKLFILDDDAGTRNIWRVTKDNDLISKYLLEINKSRKNWDLANLGTYKEGEISDFSDDIIVNREENARQLMDKGLDEGTSYQLRQAARIYSEINNIQTAAKCNGYAEIFNKNYYNAGERFNDGGWNDLALQAFLLANNIPSDIKGIKKIMELSVSKSAITGSFFYLIASSVCDKSFESLEKLLDFILHITALPFEKYFPHDAMKNIIGDALNYNLEQLVDNKQLDDTLYNKIISVYENEILNIRPDIIAQSAFCLSKFKAACDYWNKSSNINKKDYEYAQMQIKGFPDNISLLYSAKDYRKIIDEYNLSKDKMKLTNDAMLFVIQALFFENDRDKAIELLVNIHSAAKYNKIIKECLSCLDPRDKDVLYICQRVSIIFEEVWNKNLLLVENLKNENINPIYIALALSRTDSLPSQLPNIKKIFSNFLDREIIRKFDNIPNELIFDIGTAIEKTELRIDILRYYEMAIKRFMKNSDNERICVERWILAKETQAKRSGSKDEVLRMQEAEEKRKEYGIEGEIESFIKHDGKTSVIKYIIDSELDKKDEKIKQEKVTIKIPQKKSDKQIKLNNDDLTGDISQQYIKQKVEFSLDNYNLVYFTKPKRLNITSNIDGKTISIQYSEQEKDCISTHDFNILNTTVEEIGNCFIIEKTPIHFCITKEKILVYFNNTNVVFNFL